MEYETVVNDKYEGQILKNYLVVERIRRPLTKSGHLKKNRNGNSEAIKYRFKCLGCGKERIVYRTTIIKDDFSPCPCGYEVTEHDRLKVGKKVCKYSECTCPRGLDICCYQCSDFRDCTDHCINSPATCGGMEVKKLEE